jgi:hypothetical protein
VDAEFRIEPEPTEADRQAIIKAVEELLEREEHLARPSTWRLFGWVAQRTGITDLARWMPSTRVWPLSARLPRGGREFPGLSGRGDAK